MNVTQLSISTRPRTFTEVYNQVNVVKELITRRDANNWPTAMLLKGPTGTGKTTCAHLIAMTINCKNPDEHGNPCGQCASCKSIIEERFDRDVVVLDGSSFSGKDDVIDFGQLADSAPMYDRKKVLIIEESDQLSTAAKNAMLKLLEKPRTHVHFILLSMINTGIPTSIQSRCQVFNFRAFTTKDIMLALKGVMERLGMWDDTSIPDEFKTSGLASIAGSAKGSLREAVQYLEKCLIGQYYTPEAIRVNLGILDEAVIRTTILKLLSRDLSFFTDVYDMNVEEFFNICYSTLVDAYIYSMTGFTKNEYYESSIKTISTQPSLRELLVVMDDIAKESKPYLRKAYFFSRIGNWFSKRTATLQEERKTAQQQVDESFKRQQTSVEVRQVRGVKL